MDPMGIEEKVTSIQQPMTVVQQPYLPIPQNSGPESPNDVQDSLQNLQLSNLNTSQQDFSGRANNKITKDWWLVKMGQNLSQNMSKPWLTRLVLD